MRYFLLVLILAVSSCSASRVLVKDCKVLEGAVQDCEMIREL